MRYFPSSTKIKSETCKWASLFDNELYFQLFLLHKQLPFESFALNRPLFISICCDDHRNGARGREVHESRCLVAVLLVDSYRDVVGSRIIFKRQVEAVKHCGVVRFLRVIHHARIEIGALLPGRATDVQLKVECTAEGSDFCLAARNFLIAEGNDTSVTGSLLISIGADNVNDDIVEVGIITGTEVFYELALLNGLLEILNIERLGNVRFAIEHEHNIVVVLVTIGHSILTADNLNLGLIHTWQF